MYLTDTELEELTGYARRSKQIEWLTRRGYVFEVSGSGKPVVNRTHANQKQGCLSASTAKRQWMPNVAAIR